MISRCVLNIDEQNSFVILSRTHQCSHLINNSSQVSQHDDTKDYLMKPVRDTNYDKKMSWYGNSLNYRATLP